MRFVSAHRRCGTDFITGALSGKGQPALQLYGPGSLLCSFRSSTGRCMRELEFRPISARRKKSKTWARWTARQCRKLFQAKPMPELQSPVWELAFASPLIHRPALLRNEHQDETGPFVVISKS